MEDNKQEIIPHIQGLSGYEKNKHDFKSWFLEIVSCRAARWLNLKTKFQHFSYLKFIFLLGKFGNVVKWAIILIWTEKE
jgi:hypothetical protein